MKASIQMYGMILVFVFMVFFIPQLLNLSMAYSRCNSVVMYAIDCVEGYDGVYDIDEINEIILKHCEKYENIEVSVNKIDIDDNYYKYEVIVTNKVIIKLINLEYTINTKKSSRRVSY